MVCAVIKEKLVKMLQDEEMRLKGEKKVLQMNNRGWQVRRNLPMACGETRWQKSEANMTRIMG